MVDDPIPDDVRDFVIRHIHSIAQLEALLIFRGSQHENWTMSAIAKRLYTSDKVAAGLLAELCDASFLHASDGTYTFFPSPEDKHIIDRLASIYSRHLIPVTNLIHGKAHRIRQFSDAFKLKKE